MIIQRENSTISRGYSSEKRSPPRHKCILFPPRSPKKKPRMPRYKYVEKKTQEEIMEEEFGDCPPSPVFYQTKFLVL